MSSPESDGDAGTAAAADGRAFSPDFADGERGERDAAAATATPQAASGTSAALGSEAAQHVKGAASTAAEPTAGASEPTAGTRGATDVVDLGKNMLDEIRKLKKEQQEARAAKKAVTKQLRNAERCRQRLKQRAKQLSDADLLAVISLRNHEKSMSQRDSATDEGDHEDAKSNSACSGAGPSSGAQSKASTEPSSKKQRGC